MKIQRYPGTAPFSESERKLFFGRDEDIERLHQLVGLEHLTVLYGKSGYGKSSMVMAELLPRMIRDGYQAVKVRFEIYTGDDKSVAPALRTRLPIVEKKKGQPITLLDKFSKDDGSIWFALKRHQLLTGENRFFLVFDQFEELFSYPKAQIESFKQQMADLLYQPVPQRFLTDLEQALQRKKGLLTDAESQLLYQQPDVRVLFLIRSDWMSWLNRLRDYLPGILANSFELLPMNADQATEAIVFPAAYNRDDLQFQTPPFEYAPDALQAILGFLSQETLSGDNTIQPFQLQIICEDIERRLIQGELKERVVKKGDLGDLQDIYGNYYHNRIAALPDETVRQAARVMIEDGLTINGRRQTVDRDALMSKYKVSAGLLQQLEQVRLLRSEPNSSGGTSYEISHDTLLPPILESKEAREEVERARQAAEESARLQAETNRNKREAETQARLETERKRRRTARNVAIGGGILALISIFATIFAILQYRDAHRNAVSAAKERDKVQYLLETFSAEICQKQIDDGNALAEAGKYQEAIALYQRGIQFNCDTTLTQLRIRECQQLLTAAAAEKQPASGKNSAAAQQFAEFMRDGDGFMFKGEFESAKQSYLKAKALNYNPTLVNAKLAILDTRSEIVRSLSGASTKPSTPSSSSASSGPKATMVSNQPLPGGGTYSGMAVNGVPEGRGVLLKSNGDKYEGLLHDGEPEGIGKMTYSDGRTFSGTWKGGQFVKGRLVRSNGDVYEGEFNSRGDFQGNGVYRWKDDGSRYVGSWKSGKFEGEGILYDVKGKEIQRGPWRNGKSVKK